MMMFGKFEGQSVCAAAGGVTIGCIVVSSHPPCSTKGSIVGMKLSSSLYWGREFAWDNGLWL